MVEADLVEVDDLVLVGRIGRAHGLRGEATVAPHTDDPALRFAVGARLRTDSPQRPALLVEGSRLAGGRWLLSFAGVDDRAGAEALRGVRLFTPAAARPALEDPDDFYDTDLVGLRAVLMDGAAIGEVIGVIHPPGGDALVVRAERREVLIPFVRRIVPTVDLGAGTVRIDPPEGLLDL
jgi:16S rRNA processing protein RimM